MKKKLNILDCTLRDGGYYNNWDFTREVVNDYLNTMSKIGVKYVELGFRSFQARDFKGPTWYTTESYLESLHIPKSLKIGVMVNVSEITSHPSGIVNAIKLSIKFLNDKPKKNTTIFNLGTNQGLSVLHIIKQAFKTLKVSTKIKYQYKRKGDVPKIVCKYNFINKILGWSPKNSQIKKIILSEYIWQKKLKTNRRFIY